MKGKNLGRQLEEIVKLKNKAEVQTDKLGKEYVLTTTKVARNVITQLQKELSLLDDKDTKETSIEIADAIYKNISRNRLYNTCKDKRQLRCMVRLK